MIATLGSFGFDHWQGPPPPPVKSSVELVYRPGQATAAAKVLPNQSQEGAFEGLAVVVNAAAAHALEGSYKALIGTVVAVTFGGVAYGNVLVKDVTVTEIRQLISAAGTHPNGTAYAYAAPYNVRSRWSIVRLSA